MPRSMGFSSFSAVPKIMSTFQKFFLISEGASRRNCLKARRTARIRATILKLILAMAEIRNPVNANVDSYF